MLTADLLRTRARGDRITPIFAELEDDNLSLAGDIIRAFTDHTGKRLGELYDILEEMEDQGFDYRLVRGLVALLERRCALKVESSLSPEMVRREAFMAAGGPVLTYEDRKKAIAQAAAKLGLSPEEVESSMFADLESELVIGGLSPPNPLDLLKEYNLSLAQAMLFKATELRFRASAGHKGILRAVKRLGLMYFASHDGERLDITIDGPMSVFRSTERYGASLARLLPFIVASPGWSVEASIVRKDFSGNPRLYRFIMEERTHGHLFGLASNDTIEFDSEPEDRFYESFRNAGTGWQITREPEPLIAGKYLYIPDFLLEKDNIKVYVEVAGFWTAEYLMRKVAKLAELKDVNLIVLASTRESCDAFKKVTENVILFDRKIPLKEVLDRLKAWDEVKIARDVERLKRTGLKLEGDVINIEALSEKAGISAEAIRRYLEDNATPGYTLAGNEVLSPNKMEEIRKSMKDTMRYAEASALIRSKGVEAVDPVLKALDYTVKWSSLDPEDATVNKRPTAPGFLKA